MRNRIANLLRTWAERGFTHVIFNTTTSNYAPTNEPPFGSNTFRLDAPNVADKLCDVLNIR